MMRWMKNRRRIISVLLSFALVLSALPAGHPQAEEPTVASLPVSSPRVSECGPTAWDCVWFGHYWQNDTNKDRKANREDDKEPIRWRVLSVDEEDIFLLAEQNLDVMPWDNSGHSVTWKNCSMRSWLNGYSADNNLADKDYSADNFLDQAFTEEEQSVIADSLVVNADNPIYQTMGGKNTNDKVFLLSVDEAVNPAYGFSGNLQEKSESRISTHTEFVWDGGTIETSSMRMYQVANSGTNSYWWLRTPGDYGKTWVNRYGGIDYSGQSSKSDYIAVRPALRMKRSAFGEGLCQYAGFVESDEDCYELCTTGTSRKVSNPRLNLKENKVTWDCVWFGNYWQDDTTGDGIADQNDDKQPILWRVLEIEGNDVFLVSDRNLDEKQYNETEDKCDATWETCTLRSWLNGYDATANTCGIDYQRDNFFATAFSEKERKAILYSNLVNKSTYYQVDGGNNTADRIFCLSYDDVVHTWEYGFKLGDSIRQAKDTSYAAQKGFGDIDAWWKDWWLRTTGRDNAWAAIVSEYGISIDYGTPIHWDNTAVRPALHVDLAQIDSASFSYAGTVTRYNGGRMELLDAPPIPTPTVTPSAPPQETPTVAPSDPPSAIPSEMPTETPTAISSEMPSVVPSEAPATKPSETPTKTPSAEPSKVPSELPTVKPSETPTETPSAGLLEPPSGNVSDGINLRAAILSVKLSSNNAPVIRWKMNGIADGYQLYRSRKKSKGYRLIKEFSSKGILRYTDRKAGGKKRYYYRLRCCKKTTQGIVYGGFSKICSIKTLNLIRPKIKGSKGVTASQIPYIELKLKRYRGTKLSIYYRIGKGKYKRLKLMSSSIKKNRRRFRIQCSKVRRTYYFKVKTSIRRKGRRYYSRYSNVVKIKG